MNGETATRFMVVRWDSGWHETRDDSEIRTSVRSR